MQTTTPNTRALLLKAVSGPTTGQRVLAALVPQTWEGAVASGGRRIGAFIVLLAAMMVLMTTIVERTFRVLVLMNGAVSLFGIPVGIPAAIVGVQLGSVVVNYQYETQVIVDTGAISVGLVTEVVYDFMWLIDTVLYAPIADLANQVIDAIRQIYERIGTTASFTTTMRAASNLFISVLAFINSDDPEGALRNIAVSMFALIESALPLVGISINILLTTIAEVLHIGDQVRDALRVIQTVVHAIVTMFTFVTTSVIALMNSIGKIVKVIKSTIGGMIHKLVHAKIAGVRPLKMLGRYEKPINALPAAYALEITTITRAITAGMRLLLTAAKAVEQITIVIATGVDTDGTYPTDSGSYHSEFDDVVVDGVTKGLQELLNETIEAMDELVKRITAAITTGKGLDPGEDILFRLANTLVGTATDGTAQLFEFAVDMVLKLPVRLVIRALTCEYTKSNDEWYSTGCTLRGYWPPHLPLLETVREVRDATIHGVAWAVTPPAKSCFVRGLYGSRLYYGAVLGAYAPRTREGVASLVDRLLVWSILPDGGTGLGSFRALSVSLDLAASDDAALRQCAYLQVSIVPGVLLLGLIIISGLSLIWLAIFMTVPLIWAVLGPEGFAAGRLTMLEMQVEQTTAFLASAAAQGKPAGAVLGRSDAATREVETTSAGPYVRLEDGKAAGEPARDHAGDEEAPPVYSLPGIRDDDSAEPGYVRRRGVRSLVAVETSS
jgi:hypothetical protein